MFGFSSFVATFWHYASQREVGSQLPTSDQSDTLSASVNIDDIIDEYDEPSRRSKNASVLSFSNARQLSQSYFSLSARRDEDTTSFYSALQDGFPLDEYDLRNKYSQDFFWNSCSKERDTMLPSKDFVVSWHDIVYAIKPKPTTCYLLNEIQNKLLSSAPFLGSCSKSGVYNLNQEDSDSQNGNEKITILRQINGSFKSGELTAIMGPSGAGKTSLLNFLSRRREDDFTGSLCVDDANHRIRIIAIPQDDHLPEYLTVRENLMFASRLKSPNCHQDHEKNVGRLSTCLGLDECLDTRTKNISGGQQKRLAIAQELLSKPEILILDEPTSGLDSLTCYKTLTVLKDLVKASAKKIIDPIAIVLTIHQPQHEAFDLFDKVYVMASGGIAIYDGPPSRCAEFVEKYAGIKMPSQNYNPASFLIDIASGEYGQEPIEALARQVKHEFEKKQGKCLSSVDLKGLGKSVSLDNNTDFMNTNKTNVTGGILHQGFDQISTPNRKPTLYLDPKLAKGSTMNQGRFLLKTSILTKRCWISLVRDRNQLIARILFHIFLPLGFSYIMGLQAGQANACPRFKADYPLKGLIDSDEYTSPQVQEELLLTLENVGTLFISIYCCICANIAAMTLVFTIDMKSSLKEFYNGWYSMNSYILARMLSNIPLNLILPTIFIALVYYTTGQNTGNGDLSNVYRILIIALAVIIGSSIGELMGMIFGAIYVGHITTALFASQGAMLPFVLLSGFVARAKNMSQFVRALSMTSLYRHCLEVTFIARYGFNVCNCDPKIVNGQPVSLSGVSEELKSFIRYYAASQEEEPTIANSSEPLESYSNETDMFQLIAKQVSLYNTYGIDVKSCNEVRPYQMYDFDLTEKDLPASFLALVTLFLTVFLILLITVKLVVEYRTSL